MSRVGTDPKASAPHEHGHGPAETGRRVALAMLALLAVAPGCEPRRQRVRRDDPTPNALMLPAPDDPSFERPDELRSFFKANKRYGTLSSEGQEIESSLGAR